MRYLEFPSFGISQKVLMDFHEQCKIKGFVTPCFCLHQLNWNYFKTTSETTCYNVAELSFQYMETVTFK